MNGTIASILRAPAHEWPEIVAREERDHERRRTMRDEVTVTLTPAELHAVLSLVQTATDARASDLDGPSIWRLDLRAARAKLEDAGRTPLRAS